MRISLIFMLTLMLAVPAAHAATATFVKIDSATRGNWVGAYGSDGYFVSQDANIQSPSYAAVSFASQGNHIWADPSTSPSALQEPEAPATRIAGVWFTEFHTYFTIQVNITDGGTHQISLYALDYDAKGRAETITVTDAATRATLSTQTLTTGSFVSGKYLVWNVSGNVLFTIITTSTTNAVISGLFFNTQSASTGSAPTQAQAAGFTKLIFDEEFKTLNLSPNGSGTYTWYNGIWYESPSPASDFTVINSVFATTETPSDPHDSSITTMNRGAGPSTVFQYGYYEARMNWNTIPANWAAFWLFSIAHAQGTDTTPTGNEWCELDIFEAFGNSIYVGTVHDWVTSNGVTVNSQNTNNYQPLNLVDMSQWHIYGVLWTPSTITWYLDNQAIMSWPTPTICQTQQLFMILGAQVHPPQTSNVYTNVDWVHVYH